MLFKEIIGQEKVKTHLKRTVWEQRVSHAQLFLGPEGSEKLSLAIAYAQFINCKNKQNFNADTLPEADSCGSCPSCIKYDKLVHPDLHFVYPISSTKEVKKPISKEFLIKWRGQLLKTSYRLSLNKWYEAIGIERKQGIINADDCHEMIRALNYKSYESEYKVMIIWMVEKLYHSAAPKILKILEEPPDKTLFILISEKQDQIIKTILSRTQVIKIPRLSDADLTEVLVKELEQSPDEARRVINLSDGNVIEAIDIINRGEQEFPLFVSFRDWMRLCYQAKVEGLNIFVTEIAKTGREHQKTFLNYALRMIRNIMLINYNNEAIARLNEEEKEFVAKFKPFINEKNLLQIASELEETQYHIERNANPNITFMDLSLSIARLLRMKTATHI